MRFLKPHHTWVLAGSFFLVVFPPIVIADAVAITCSRCIFTVDKYKKGIHPGDTELIIQPRKFTRAI